MRGPVPLCEAKFISKPREIYESERGSAFGGIGIEFCVPHRCSCGTKKIIKMPLKWQRFHHAEMIDCGEQPQNELFRTKMLMNINDVVDLLRLMAAANSRRRFLFIYADSSASDFAFRRNLKFYWFSIYISLFCLQSFFLNPISWVEDKWCKSWRRRESGGSKAA